MVDERKLLLKKSTSQRQKCKKIEKNDDARLNELATCNLMGCKRLQRSIDGLQEVTEVN